MVTPDGETDLFNITAGVMQGDTLAPFLFVIVLDFALRQSIDGKEEDFGLTIDRRRSRRVPGKHICDLDFADDIVLLSNEIEQAKNLLHAVESECLKVGFKTNVPKTKSMFFNSTVTTFKSLSGEEVKQPLTKDGNQDFLYLVNYLGTFNHAKRLPGRLVIR